MTSLRYSARSTAATASTSGSVRARSKQVRTGVVTASAPQVVMALGSSATAWTVMPWRARSDTPGATVTSTGALPSVSMPCSRAAVRPENTDPRGSRRCSAPSSLCESSSIPAQTYVPQPIRLQFGPRSHWRLKPRLSAYAMVTGPCLSCSGISCRRGMRPAWPHGTRNTTLLVQTVSVALVRMRRSTRRL